MVTGSEKIGQPGHCRERDHSFLADDTGCWHGNDNGSHFNHQPAPWICPVEMITRLDPSEYD
jgi:hypothetical protein